MIKITIETGNAAFAPELPDSWRMEVSFILRQVAARIERGETLPIKLRDQNGNVVGEAKQTFP